jgi:hypothetical protein
VAGSPYCQQTGAVSENDPGTPPAAGTFLTEPLPKVHCRLNTLHKVFFCLPFLFYFSQGMKMFLVGILHQTISSSNLRQMEYEVPQKYSVCKAATAPALCATKT